MKKNNKVALLLVSVMTFGGLLAACNSTPTQPGDDTEIVDPNATMYTVTLDPNGGKFADGTTDPKNISIRENGKIPFSQYEVTYEGNELYGWYYTNGTPFPAARKITENVTLKAKWSVAEEVEEIGLKLVDYLANDVTVNYENGVYQFYKNSPIYGGYAQRGGRYTVYEDELKNAISTIDTGSKAQCVYTSMSNYTDSTGGCYAEFFNDGTVELMYHYTNAGATTKYTMEVLYYYLDGVTMPFDAPTRLPDISGSTQDENGNVNMDALASKSIHYATNEEALAGGPGSLADPFGDTGDDKYKDYDLCDPVTFIKGKNIVATATNETGWTLNAYENGTMIIVGADNTEYEGFLWSKELNKAQEMEYHLRRNGEEIELGYNAFLGYGFAFEGQSFFVQEATFFTPIFEKTEEELVVFDATESKTMKLYFLKDGTYTVKMNYGSYGMVNVGCQGLWALDGDNLLMSGTCRKSKTANAYLFSDPNGNDYYIEPSIIKTALTA